MESIGALLPLILIVAVFYLLVLRPARSKQQQAARLQDRLAVGQRVMTTSGMFGTVDAVVDDRVGIEVAPGVVVEFVKAAVARIDEDADDDGAGPDDADLAAPGARGDADAQPGGIDLTKGGAGTDPDPDARRGAAG